MSKNGSLIASEILIVDDEEDIRDLIAGILHDEGYTTRVAGDSDSALTAATQLGGEVTGLIVGSASEVEPLIEKAKK